jgi:hypothetical protein
MKQFFIENGDLFALVLMVSLALSSVICLYNCNMTGAIYSVLGLMASFAFLLGIMDVQDSLKEDIK